MKSKQEEGKKMNPMWVILVFVILALTIICKIYIADKNSQFKLESIYQQYSKDVDAGVTELLNHQGFKGLSQDAKVKEMGKLLDIYFQIGVITNLYYTADSYMYTFTYNTEPIVGALGGVSLKEWNPYMN